MARAVSEMHPPESARRLVHYEQPLNERMRTFMRLEFLYQQLLYHFELEADWATRAATAGLLDIVAILMRGDVRSDVFKELDRQIETLERFKGEPAVDKKRLDALIHNLADSRAGVNALGPQFLQPLKDSEFLNAIKHRSAIPGGTCEFDLPLYSHWLRYPYERRARDLGQWIDAIRPVCDAVVELLWLTRESAAPKPKVAINGMYQYNVQKGANCRLLRVSLPEGSPLFPEISAHQHRFTIRFLECSSIDRRAVQTGHDVSFQLSIG
ncbi:MAG TPA: cell division protein ZapD [Woeseiaceae bacterium]|nr:cell division protein ZapD [Woeseiaceae bacterium]